MSSVEIEDVLSSIRRLVSEDLRPHAQAAAHPAQAGRLLLTPALRVVPATGDHMAPAPEPAPTVAAINAALAARRQMAEAAMAPPPEPPQQTATVFGFPARPWPSSEVIEVDLDQIEEATVIEAPFIEVEDDEDRLASAWGDGAWADQRPEIATLHFPEIGQPPAPEPEPEPVVAKDTILAAVDQQIAELAEAAALAEIQAAEDQVAAAAPKAEDEILGDDDFIIDEDVMRELVRDIIREELQGALGERITRNVRKLVRSEIQRMMISRDMS